MLGRSRFDDVVSRQLDLFGVDEVSLLDEADEADRAWTDADRDESEERYGDYQLVIDQLAERLLDVRESYAATLDPDTADRYREAFARAARKRFRRYAGLLEDD